MCQVSYLFTGWRHVWKICCVLLSCLFQRHFWMSPCFASYLLERKRLICFQLRLPLHISFVPSSTTLSSAVQCCIQGVFLLVRSREMGKGGTCNAPNINYCHLPPSLPSPLSLQHTWKMAVFGQECFVLWSKKHLSSTSKNASPYTNMGWKGRCIRALSPEPNVPRKF